jgi:hypothetical protein
MWLNKGIPTLPTLKKCQIPFGLGFRHPASGVLGGPIGKLRDQASGFLKGRFRNQASGFRLQGSIVPIIANFTVLLFYFFEKKKYRNIGTFRSIVLKSLKYKNKIKVFCSRTLQYARTVGIKHFFTFKILKT